ncbi:MAG: cobyric acid synthase [Methanomassiliicoccaceae archaeon]|nr:cobyric acid synthase [Methanomassiliicoccaceae archaeon]
MDCLKKVREELERGWTGPNPDCEYGPCHYYGQDCTYCFCPFYPCGDEELGENITTPKGKIWSCMQCHHIHRTPVCKYIASRVKELNITDPEDPRLRGLLNESKDKFMVPGKAIMVVGATSDAGKSIAVAALCRIISRKGYSVTPMKTQNMSLNSMITSDGSEIASIQMLQAKAAQLRHPDHNINPILLKPMKNGMTQVIVNGKHFGDMDVDSYYNEFVPSEGIDAVKKSIGILRKRYEFVIMEGAGSPAEINIYDKDIANMRAAETADADCILIVNVQWGGAFAYALGTIELLPPNDRKRIKGIIFNNLRGDPSSLKDGAKELERLTGVPVLGIIPHIGIPLPREDSLTLGSSDTNDEGKIRICVVKLPKIANFTDLDPLYHENVSVIYTDEPKDMKDADVIIIPGTKDTTDALRWMRSSGMDDAVKAMKGIVPIIGICGGYQIMCGTLNDPLGIEGGVPSSAEGLGLFSATVRWDTGTCKRAVVSGTLAVTGEDMSGYEVHSGETVTDESPLFELRTKDGPVNEGSVRYDEKLFGTYLHGIFDAPAFRRYILKMTGKYVTSEFSDMHYSDVLDDTMDKLADVFERSLNMNVFEKIFMGGGQ